MGEDDDGGVVVVQYIYCLGIKSFHSSFTILFDLQDRCNFADFFPTFFTFSFLREAKLGWHIFFNVVCTACVCIRYSMYNVHPIPLYMVHTDTI